MKYTFTILAASLLNTFAHSWTAARPDGHAPIGVMADHMHKSGEYMFSYRYMFMNMQDNYDGTEQVSAADIFAQGYSVAQIDMQMQMHMFGAMYAPTDKITLLAMANLINMEMLHQRNAMMTTMTGEEYFSTSSSGLGDVALGGLFKIKDFGQQSVHAGLSLILPTAETDKSDTIGMNELVLPYPMQLGAGSWGLKPSLTYLGQDGSFSWGAQASAHIQLADNESEYQLGDSLTTTAWGAYKLSSAFSTSVRLETKSWTNIEGANDELTIMPTMVPTADTSLRGGNKVDAYLGLNYYLSGPNVRFAGEIGQTLWQDLDGPQLGSDWSLTLGIQSAF